MDDEIFRDMDEFTSSDIIYSMREQMTPSDAVVASLLAKIAACDASSESFDNALPFSPAQSTTLTQTEASASSASELTSEPPQEQKRRVNRKPLWKYGSLAAAGLIVLVSTFALMGDSDSSDFKSFVDNVLPDHVVSDPLHDGDGDDGSVVGNEDSSDASDTEKNASADNNEYGNENVGADETNNGDSDSDDPENASGSADNSQADDNAGNSTAPAPDDSSASNGSTNSNASFDREILADEAVSHIAISGTDYVVDTAASKVTTGDKIKAITLTIPQTSTTNQTVANAQVKELDGVSSDLMVAVDVDGFGETLLYTNTSYQPSSLGQFIADAGLDLDIDYSSTVYCKGEKIGYTSYHRLQVDNINEFVDTYAFANKAAAVAKYSAYKNADVHVTFKTTSNPTGSVINFGVSDSGYLYVKMSGGKAFTFNIGTERAEAFISAVTGE